MSKFSASGGESPSIPHEKGKPCFHGCFSRKASHIYNSSSSETYSEPSDELIMNCYCGMVDLASSRIPRGDLSHGASSS